MQSKLITQLFSLFSAFIAFLSLPPTHFFLFFFSIALVLLFIPLFFLKKIAQLKHEYWEITKNNSNNTPDTGKMAQQKKKMAANKLGNLNLIPWTHDLQGEYTSVL